MSTCSPGGDVHLGHRAVGRGERSGAPSSSPRRRRAAGRRRRRRPAPTSTRSTVPGIGATSEPAATAARRVGVAGQHGERRRGRRRRRRSAGRRRARRVACGARRRRRARPRRASAPTTVDVEPARRRRRRGRRARGGRSTRTGASSSDQLDAPGRRPGCCASPTGCRASTPAAAAVGGLLGERDGRGGERATSPAIGSVHGCSSRKPVCRSPARNAGCSQDVEQLVAVGRPGRAAGRRASAPAQRAAASSRVGAVGDDLGDHRVVVRRRPTEPASTPVSTRTPSPAAVERVRTCRSTGGSRRPGPRRRAGPRWRGRERRGRARPSASGSPVGDAQLQLDEVEPGDHLGDRVLDLQPGVHLEEAERRRRRRGGTRRCRRRRSRRPRRRRPRRRPSGRAGRRRRPGDGDSSMIFWWRRWIEHSRSSSDDDVAVACRRGPGPRRGGRARRSARGTPCRRRTPAAASRSARPRRVGELVGGAHDAHAPAAAAGRRLDEQREADRRRRRRRPRRVESGSTGTPAARISALASSFEPIAAIAVGRRADPRQPGVDRRPGRTRRSRRGSRSRGGRRRRRRARAASISRSAAQVRVGRRRCPGRRTAASHARDVQRVGVGVAEHGDGRDAEAPARADDAAGDLAAVGDEDTVDADGASSASHPEHAVAARGPRIALLCDRRQARCRARCGCRAGR